jgi:hypothetical protein
LASCGWRGENSRQVRSSFQEVLYLRPDDPLAYYSLWDKLPDTRQLRRLRLVYKRRESDLDSRVELREQSLWWKGRSTSGRNREASVSMQGYGGSKGLTHNGKYAAS